MKTWQGFIVLEVSTIKTCQEITGISVWLGGEGRRTILNYSSHIVKSLTALTLFIIITVCIGLLISFFNQCWRPYSSCSSELIFI